MTPEQQAEVLARVRNAYAQTSCTVAHFGKYGESIPCPDQPLRDGEAMRAALATLGYEVCPKEEGQG